MSDADHPDRDDAQILAGEYALGLLSDEDAAAFEARLVTDPVLRAHYAAWAEDFACLTDDIAPVAPPAQMLKVIEDRLFDDPRAPLWVRLGVWRVVCGLGAAAVIAVALLVSSDLFRPTLSAPTHLAQIAAEDGSLVVAAAYDAGAGTLSLARSSGAAAEGRALELWLIAGDTPPVSLGVLPADAQVVLAIAAELQAKMPGGVLAISDEPTGGSPTGEPTGAVLALGPITDA